MPSALILTNAGLRCWIFVFSVISLGIEGHLRASNYDTARVNLGIAASVIGLVFSVFIPWIVLFVGALYNQIVLFVLDFISFALYVSASGSLTQQRGQCHEPGRGKCGEFKAGFAFLYMSWIILLFTMVLGLYQFFTEGNPHNSAFDSKIRRPASAFPRKERPASSGFADHIATEEPSPQSTNIPPHAAVQPRPAEQA